MCLESPEKGLFQGVSKGEVISGQNMNACKEVEVQL